MVRLTDRLDKTIDVDLDVKPQHNNNKTFAKLRGCTGSHEPLMFVYVISTLFTWAGSFELFKEYRKLTF